MARRRAGHERQPVRPVRGGHRRRSWWPCWPSSSRRTRIGRALRAVADDHQAALAVGIPLQQIWAIVWTVAGFVALVAGLLWGARNGVQFSLTFIALKALPVLILGGFESIAGRDRRRPHHRRLGEAGRGLHRPAASAAASRAGSPTCSRSLFLLVRPEGPVRREAHRAGLSGCSKPMLYREAGQFKTTYAADQQIFPIRQDRIGVAVAARRSRSWSCRSSRNQYWLSAILIPFLILALAALGLNILTGYAGQLSLGHRGVHGGRRVRRLQLRCCACRGCRSSSRFALGGRRARRWSASCSACRACASRASTSPSRRWPAQFFVRVGAAPSSAGSPTTAPPA